MKELKLTPNPEHSMEADKAGIAGSSQRIAQYICPITGLEMNGRYRLVTCQWDQNSSLPSSRLLYVHMWCVITQGSYRMPKFYMWCTIKQSSHVVPLLCFIYFSDIFRIDLTATIFPQSQFASI